MCLRVIWDVCGSFIRCIFQTNSLGGLRGVQQRGKTKYIYHWPVTHHALLSAPF